MPGRMASMAPVSFLEWTRRKENDHRKGMPPLRSKASPGNSKSYIEHPARLTGMRLIEMILDEESIANGVDAISLVEEPAIQSNFLALAKAKPASESHKVDPLPKQVQFATINPEKRLVMGAVLVPDKPIIRMDERGEPFHVFFSKQTVRQASELFLKRGYQNSATLEHAVKLQGVSVVESWIVDNPEMDKAKHYGLETVEGQWMVAMKIDQDTVWNEYVKTGKVKGFSIEGWFKDRPAKMSQATAKKTTAKIIRKR